MRRLLAVLISATAIGTAAAVEPGPQISVEFNDLQQAGSGCRAVFVLNNGMGKPLEEVALRVVAFDGKGRATLFLSLDVGALPVGKTRVLRFDLGENTACSDVSRLVLDDVTSCGGADVTPATCLEAIKLSSRGAVSFDF